MQQNSAFKAEIVETDATNADRFLSQIRLFLAFKKAAGENIAEQESLLDTLAGMHQRLYGQKRVAGSFDMPQTARSFGHQMAVG